MIWEVTIPQRAAEVQILQDQVDAELVRIVFADWMQCADGIPFALIIAVAMSGWFPALGATDPEHILVWTFGVSVWAAVALLVLRQYRRASWRFSVSGWRRNLTVLWFAHGVLWGLLIPTFWNHGNPVNQALLCGCLLGAMVHGFFLLYPLRRIFLINLCALCSIAELTFITDGGSLAQIFSIIVPPFAGLIMWNGWRLSGEYRNAIKLRFEKDEVVRALDAATREAQQANRAKSEFLANMSHELRTPLNAIIGFGEIIRDQTYRHGPMRKHGDYAADITDSGRHLLTIINQILDLAKIEAGKMALELEEVSLSATLHECIRTMRVLAKERHLDLSFENNCGDIIIYGDKTALRRILINVISNAIKFTDDGSVKVTANECEGSVSIEVIDTGRGISEGQLGNIFVPFERAENHLSATTGGCGLGLAIVKRLVEMHHGTCAVRSQLGQGTSFVITLPLRRSGLDQSQLVA